MVSSSVLFGQNLTANFSVNEIEICLGESVDFTDLSTAGNSPIVTWTWDFGDGFSSQIQSPTHVFTAAGTYNITLTVQAQDGTSDVEIKQAFIIVHPLPQVNFSLSNQGCSVPFNAVFTNTSSAGAFTYAWDFGNGQTATDFTPTGIVYATEGTYNVTLIVTNTNTGCTNTLVNQIQVANYEANITMPDSVCVFATTIIDDASTAGSNSWSWDFGNGQFSTTENNGFIYTAPGTYSVTLTSSNTTLGCSDTYTQSIVVMPVPTADFVADVTLGCNPLTVTFTNNSSGGASYSWNFGDGSTYVGQTPPPHVYSDTGTFSVFLVAATAFGCTDIHYLLDYITVEDLEVGFMMDVMGGCDPLDVQFTDTTMVPNPGQDPIVNWDWDFGNGNTYNGQFPPVETYNLGVYDVSLTVTTSTGCIADTIYNDSITVGIIDSVGFTYFPIDVCAKVPISFTNTSVISVPHNPSEVLYNWDFGDGGTSTNENPSYGYPSDTGYFDVTLVVDFRGCLDTATLVDAVHINAPISNFSLSSSLVCNPASFPVTIETIDNSIIGELPDDAEMIWDWGDTTFTYYDDPDFDDADQGAASHDYDDYGTYMIEQVIHNYTTGCSDSSTAFVVISALEANISYANDSICFNDQMFFGDSSVSTHAIVYDTVTNYYDMGNGEILWGWNQLYTYPASGSYDIIHYVTNAAGCADSDTLEYTVLDLPLANISSSAASGCAPLNVVFTNNSSSQGNGVPLDSFSWVFYDGTTQITTDVNQTVTDFFDFENSFLTTLTVTDEFGCVSGSAFTITDLTKPTANFAVDTVICDLENFNAVNQSLGSGPLTYEWLIDGNYQDNTLNYSNQFDEQPSNLYSSVQHTLSLVTTDVNGCLDTLEVPIHVSLPHADANFSFSGATINAQGEFVCPPVFASLNDSSSSFGNVTNWNWTFGNGNSSTLQNPQNTYVYAGTYTATLSIVDEFGCVDDSTFTDYVTINGPSGDPGWTSVGTFCDPAFEFYTENQSGITNVEWTLGNGSIINDTSAFTYIYDTTGVYLPTVILSDNFGCEVPYILPQISVAINELDAFFEASMLEGEVSEIVTFDDLSTSSADPIVDWNWDFGTYSQLNNTDADVDYDWSNTGYQTVTLTVSDANGCSGTYSLQVLITAEFFVPNVFTPNGDGVNEFFAMDFDVFNGYDYVIVNRWGNVVKQAQDHTGVLLWDGNVNSGSPCTEGVYFYRISGELYDGTPITKHGNVTLVR
ncbi:MAG: gliding motility-associated-like protein [Crocinitomicaceae bacterium]|jgi:gliding motility-associated-like protein